MGEPGWRVAIDEVLERANEGGAAPGDIAQHVLEAAHRMEPMPCGEGEAGQKLRITTVEEATGRMEQKVMGPNADYVLTVGPEFEVAAVQRYGNGTTQLTVKRAATQPQQEGGAG